MNRSISNLRSALAIVSIAGACSFLQAEPPKEGKSEVLGGPPVRETRVPGERGSFGDGANKLRREGANEIPHPAFMRAINAALGEGAPEDVRVSPEIRAQIMAINDEFSAAQREYFGKNKGDLEKLRPGAIKESRTQGKKPGKDATNNGAPAMDGDGMSPAEREAMAEKVRTLRMNAPQATDAHKKIWGLLNEKQQAAAQVKLDEIKAKLKSELDEKYVEREKAKLERENAAKEAAKTGRPGGDAPPKRPAAASPGGADPERRERLLRLFERLSPEQREQLLQRLEGLANGNAPARQGKRGGPEPEGDKKPAPNMDEINVPR
ncbi:MAG: hypothetical protein ACT4PL_00820 [Phycisphaerales bacterium]